jgi:hypothetical protein
MRTGMGVINPRDGFIEGNAEINNACNGVKQMNPTEKVGFCVAGGKTETTASFGGRTNFSDITDFIAYIFRLSFTFAIAFAVVMILISGIQWMSSGGNSSIISDAKTRILNSMLGILLLAMSYTLLDTINPALVRLRPLDIYLINPISVAPEYCSDLTNTPTLYPSRNNSADLSTPTLVTAASCGQEFFIQNAGEQTCRGDVCPDNKTCAPLTITATGIELGRYDCIEAEYVLRIDISSFQEIVRQGTVEAFGNIVTWFTDTANSPNWIGNNPIAVFPVCQYITRNGQSLSMIPYRNSSLSKPMNWPKLISSNNLRIIATESRNPLSPLNDYYIIINDLTSELSNSCDTLPQGRVSARGEEVKLLGFILQIKLDNSSVFNWDHDLFLGNNGVIDKFPTSIGASGTYFPIKNLQSGTSILQYSITETHLRNAIRYRPEMCLFNNNTESYLELCGEIK